VPRLSLKHCSWIVAAIASASQAFAQSPAANTDVEQKIERQWRDDASLNACRTCELHVIVLDGITTITGIVPTDDLKARAARLARAAGARSVDNRVIVDSEAPARVVGELTVGARP
jgi:osmotically-inducible protein OsmY